MAIEVVNIQERLARIEHECENPISKGEVWFRGQTKPVARIRIPHNWLVYRMNNKRTRVLQLDYERDYSRDQTFFKFGQESDASQDAQHELLLDLSKDNKANIYRELQQRRVQIAPLAVTREGVVVDGNRRLAAMRDLLREFPSDYVSFEHVDVLVLPSEAIESDLAEYEAQLQMAPHLRLDYGWVELRLAIRDIKAESLMTDDQIVNIFRFKDIAELNARIRQLDLAEEFLDQFMSSPYDYKRVADMEQFFSDLQDALDSHQDHTDLRRLVAFNVASANKKGALEGRLYAHNRLFGKDFRQVASRLIEEEELTSSGENQVATDSFDDDPLNPGNFDLNSEFEPIRQLLSDVNNSSEIAVRLVDIGQAIEDERRDDQSRMAPVKKIRQIDKALTYLERHLGEGQVRERVLREMLSLRSRMSALLETQGGGLHD